MKKTIRILLFFAMAILLLTGCELRSVEKLYSLPKRSEAYKELQVVVDSAMGGLSYCAPRSGENQQTLQMADLDGDGTTEYILFAKGSDEKPLHILVFKADTEGYTLFEHISSYGTSFDQVEYANVDGRPGEELIVGRQLSDQVVRSVSVYGFASGQAEQLVSANYTKYLTCDLNQDKKEELLVIHPGEAEEDNGIAEYYSYSEGVMERSAEVAMSEPAEKMKRVTVSRLEGGVPAVYVASAVDENAIITDVFAVINGHLTNVSFSSESGTSVKTLRNYYIYADDIDGDGVMELPDLIPLRRDNLTKTSGQPRYLVRWYSLLPNGEEVDKRYTYHNYDGGWYLTLDKAWVRELSIVQSEGAYSFYLPGRTGNEKEKILTIYSFTGKDRDVQASAENRFFLDRSEAVVYAAELEGAAAAYGIDHEYMTNNFHLIRLSWKSGET